MRKYIDLMVVKPEVITEGNQNYEAMFNAIKALAVADDANTPADGNYATECVTHRIKDAIAWAKQKLVRKDRIVWYLRLERIEMAEELWNWVRLQENKSKSQQLRQRYKEEYHRLAHETYSELTAARRYLRHNLEHFLSLPIHAIQATVLNHQGVEMLQNDWGAMEYEWKKGVINAIPATGQEDIILEFSDGWAWIDLHAAYSREEAEAMGHCGNSPRSSSGDTILSLRKKIEHNGNTFWEPHLTFILNDADLLTEMKGRGNDKPAAKYHKYIIPLLQTARIDGIVGGGYLPGNNFSMADLDDAEAAALVSDKPGLATPYQYYELKGYDEVLAAKIITFAQANLKEEIWDVSEERVTVAQYDNYNDFIEAIPDDSVSHYSRVGARVSAGILALLADQRWSELSLEFPLIQNLESFEDTLRGDEDEGIDDDYQYLANFIIESYGSIEAFVDKHHELIGEWQSKLRRMAVQYSWDWIPGFIEKFPFRAEMLHIDFGDDNEVLVWASTRDFLEASEDLLSDGEEADQLRVVQNAGWLYTGAGVWDDHSSKGPKATLQQIQRAIRQSAKRLVLQQTGGIGQGRLDLRGGQINSLSPSEARLRN